MLMNPYGGQNPQMSIQKVANGWCLTMPINISEDNDYNEYGKVLRNVAVEMADRMKYDDDELLIKGKKKEEKKEASPLIGYIPPIPNVFIFTSYDLLLEFLKTSVY